MRIRPTLLLILVFSIGVSALHIPNGEARRVHLSTDQQTQLAKVKTISLQVLALTEKGPYDATSLTQTVQSRLEELGYLVVTNADQPHDVQVKVKCEEQKTWTGTSPTGGDVE